MKFLAGILFGVLLVALSAGLYVWTGSFNVAASVPTGRLEEGLARFALNRAIARRASPATNPLSSSPETLREGLAHYRENCAGCHGAPGVDAAEYGEGLNPPAPDLTLPRVQKRPDGELYWIVSNGIRMTGMPAFAPTHKEREVWTIVAFLRHLPALTAGEEKALKAETEEASHHHGEPEAPSGHASPPDATPHRD